MAEVAGGRGVLPAQVGHAASTARKLPVAP
jgi:hypothetical protein